MASERVEVRTWWAVPPKPYASDAALAEWLMAQHLAAIAQDAPPADDAAPSPARLSGDHCGEDAK